MARRPGAPAPNNDDLPSHAVADPARGSPPTGARAAGAARDERADERDARTVAAMRVERQYRTMQEIVYNTIKERILKGQYAPGQRLITNDLANELGVSRMPVREALQRLEAATGLVTLIPHKGAAVNALSEGNVRGSPDVRISLSAPASVVANAEFDLLVTPRNTAGHQPNPDVNSARNVRFTVNLDGGTRLSGGANGHGFTCSGTTSISCSGGFLDVLDEETIRFRIKAPAQPQTLNLSAHISTLSERNQANNNASLNVTVLGRADLTVTRPEGAEAIASGAEEDYRVRVANVGTARATGVIVNLSGQSLPLDFTGADLMGSTRGFTCRIVRGQAGTTGTAQAQCTGGTLDPGLAVDIRLRTRGARINGVGTGQLIAVVDPGNAIVETNEANNRSSLLIREN